MSKQDRQGVRTAADFERKYNFGKSFAELFGLAQEAILIANGAQRILDGITEDMTAEGIFNILTNNGEDQGIYRWGGKIYLNGEYIKANTIVGNAIRAGSISASHIAAGAITADKLAAGAITAETISGGLVSASAITTGILTSRDGTSFVLDLDNNTLTGNFTSLSIGGIPLSEEIFDAAAMESRMTTAETSISLNSQEIALRATKTEVAEGIAEVDGKFGDYATLAYTNAEILVLSDRINAIVEGSVEVDLGNYYTKTEMDAELSAMPGEIMLSVSGEYTKITDFNTYKDEASAEFSLRILKTDNDQIISMIRAKADNIDFIADKFVIDSTNFKVSGDGTIEAYAGETGGWSLGRHFLTSDEYTFGLYSGSLYRFQSFVDESTTSPARFFCGTVNPENSVITHPTFYVLADGSLYSTAAKFFGQKVVLDNVTIGNSTLDNATLNNGTLDNATLNSPTLNDPTLDNPTLNNPTMDNVNMETGTLGDDVAVGNSNMTVGEVVDALKDIGSTGPSNKDYENNSWSGSYERTYYAIDTAYLAIYGLVDIDGIHISAENTVNTSNFQRTKFPIEISYPNHQIKAIQIKCSRPCTLTADYGVMSSTDRIIWEWSPAGVIIEVVTISCDIPTVYIDNREGDGLIVAV